MSLLVDGASGGGGVYTSPSFDRALTFSSGTTSYWARSSGCLFRCYVALAKVAALPGRSVYATRDEGAVDVRILFAIPPAWQSLLGHRRCRRAGRLFSGPHISRCACVASFGVS